LKSVTVAAATSVGATEQDTEGSGDERVEHGSGSTSGRPIAARDEEDKASRRDHPVQRLRRVGFDARNHHRERDQHYLNSDRSDERTAPAQANR
jgi:hypothetical protein